MRIIESSSRKNLRNKYRTCMLALMVVFAMMFTSSGVQFASAKRALAPATLQPLLSSGNPALDSTFHFDGKVTTEFGPNSEAATAVAVQPDGKIIAAGYAYNGVNSPVTYNDFALARYNSDGSLDDGSSNDSTPNDSFGTQGKVITDFNLGADQVNDLAIQPDGKIVAVGYATILVEDDHDPDPQNDKTVFGMARYNSDGSLDTTFNTSGKVTTDFESRDLASFRSMAEAVAIQLDGKIVLAGHHYANLASHEDHVALARYNSDGSPDNSFDGDGMVQTSLGGGSCSNDSSRAYDLAIQPDGRLVIVGEAGIHGGTFGCSLVALTVARYTQFGQLDASFNGNGRVYTNFIARDSPRNSGEAVALQADGKILAAGWVEIDPNGGRQAFALARYNSDGSLDSTFGNGGKVKTEVSNNTATAHSIAIESGGRILLAGSRGGSDSVQDFFLARYNPDGSPDHSFGNLGTFAVDFTDGPGVIDDQANAIAVQPDGRIVMAGASGELPNYSSFVASRLSTHVADLAISMDVSTDDVITGTKFTYTITATNLGPNVARPVEITDVLPPELTFVSSDPVLERRDNNNLVLSLDGLDSGSSARWTIEATVSCLAVPGKAIANTARVTSPVHDVDTSNNSATAEAIPWVALPIRCPSDIVSYTRVVNYPPPKISEDWPDVSSVKCSPVSGSSFPIGTTTVECVASDREGNTASCHFNVTVAMFSTK